MSFVQIVVLALVQGITEFLPISSSGHLVLGSWLFDWPDQGLLFDAGVHVGTLVAVVIYFRNEWLQILFGLASNAPVNLDDEGNGIASRLVILLIVVAMIPVVVGALLIREAVEANFRTPEAVGWLLIGTAMALLVGELLGRRVRDLSSLRLQDAAAIGLAQVLAIFPGISRSGVTMVAGLALGLKRDAAARFSMLLATPAIAGAGLLIAVDSLGEAESDEWTAALTGAVISAVTAYFVIAGLLKLLQHGTFRPFIAYCGVVGIAVLIARAAGA